MSHADEMAAKVAQAEIYQIASPEVPDEESDDDSGDESE